jgi:hypothetical protein
MYCKVERAVLNIANRGFTPILTYVAVSRVQALDSVLFEERFKPRVSSQNGRTEGERCQLKMREPFHLNPFPFLCSVYRERSLTHSIDADLPSDFDLPFVPPRQQTDVSNFRLLGKQFIIDSS